MDTTNELIRENQILSIGSPLLDILVCVDSKFLEKYKLNQNNAIVASKIHENLFKEISKLTHKLTTGGSVTTTARILQRLLKVPKSSCYLGAVGNDSYGHIIENDLNEENVNCILEKVSNVPTGRCIVLLTEKNRSLVTELGASKLFNNTCLRKQNVLKIVQSVDYFYMSAFFFGVSYETIQEICRYSSLNNKTFVLNIGAPFLCETYKQQFKTILGHTNILVGNRDEAKSLAKILNIVEQDIKKVTKELNNSKFRKRVDNKMGNLTIITNGQEPIIIAHNRTILTFEVPKVANEKVINTNGAGDCFIGGFLAAHVQNKRIEDCVKCGIDVATNVIQENDFSSLRFIL